jgi:multidrug efflux pump subunit AcrA (membrane-fusion protein)
MKRYWIPAAALILFFFGGWTLRNKLAADRQGEWVSVARGDLVTGVEVTGVLAAVESDTLGPPQIPDVWDFKISMLAPEGTDIKKGRPVLAFDTTNLQRRLDDNQAVADQARKEIEKQRANVAVQREDRKLQLAEAQARMRKASLKLDAPPDIVGVTERKEVELEHDLAKREVESIQSRLASFERAAAAAIKLQESKQHNAELIVKNSQDAIRQMTVLAPRDGTVVYISDMRGEKRKVGDTMWKGLRALEIPDLRAMKANGEVDEADAGKIAIGQRVTLRLDAHPDDEFHGTIVQASRIVQQQTGTKNPVKVLRVEIKLDRTDPSKMRPGMRFQGSVELARVRNTLLIPRNAVFMSEHGPVAYRRGLLSVDTVPLKLGRENDESVEVQSGLGAGDRVLVEKKKDQSARIQWRTRGPACRMIRFGQARAPVFHWIDEVRS